MGVPFAGLLGRFTSQTASETLGFGVGVALAEALRPEATALGQDAWAADPSKALDADQAATIVSEALRSEAWGEQEAAYTGIDTDRFKALVELAYAVPGLAEALALRRRQLITDADLEHALAKGRLEPRYWDAVKKTVTVLLSPEIVAAAIQQGHLPNSGVLPDVPTEHAVPAGYVAPAPPDGGGASDVPLTTINLDPLAEAAGHGVDEERLAVMANLAGLPPGPHDLLQMLNRGYITEEAADAGIREGHLKTKWTGAFKRLRWAVLPATEYASAALRTWVTKEQMYEGGALTGHTKEQMDLLFLNRGRPASPTQMWTAWARKIVGPRGVPTDYEDHAKAIAISDIRPEYAELLWGIRFTYPSLFQLTRLVDAGTVSPQTAADWAAKNRYAPEVVSALLAAWKGGGSSASKEATKTDLADEYEGGFITEKAYRDSLALLGYTGHAADLLVHLGDARRVKRYREKAIDAIAEAYTAFRVSDADAERELADVSVTGEAATLLLGVWAKRRLATIHGLTRAQIKKAFTRGIITHDQAVQALEWDHMPPADVAEYLAE